MLYAEQGLGDMIQFVRYVPMVAARGGRVIVQTYPELTSLMSTVAGAARVIPHGEPLEPHDAWAPLMSLPRIFKTNLNTIPATMPYFTVDETRAARWQARLARNSAAFKIGLVWAGRATYTNDATRSIRLSDFMPLLDRCEGSIAFYGLQKGEAAAQINELPPGRIVHNLAGELTDFADTAAAIAAMDLVISVDTAVAHLAGALGKSVWTLIPFASDWRWLKEREDSPWYPTMRLFRQAGRGDWSGVIQRAAAELSHFTARRKAG